MAAYIFFDVKDVLDGEKLQQYRSMVLATVEQFGGRYLVLGGDCDSLEGEWMPKFPVLIRFDNKAVARDWYNSDAYRIPKSLRLEGAICDAVLMESELSDFVKEF